MANREKVSAGKAGDVVEPGVSRPSDGVALDHYAFGHSTTTPAALAAFERATLAVIEHRPAVGVDLDAAIATAPNMVAAYALSGFCNVILARAETIVLAQAAYERAVRAVELIDNASPDEMAMLGSLALAAQGSLKRAADILDEHLASGLGPLLLVKLSHALRFMAGDQVGMRRTTHQVLSISSPDRVGYGFILGMHAFALEETGAYVEALRVGAKAVEREPNDSWGMHAITHVFEMTGRSRTGLSWLRSTADRWTRCNFFAGHMAWHSALFHLEQGECSMVLELYDTAVRRERSEDFRDFANAVSLLFRLAHAGVDVGDRWTELANSARRRLDQHGLIFACLHDMVALAAVGDFEACHHVLRTMEDISLEGNKDQAHVAVRAGIPLGRVVLAAIGATASMEHPDARSSIPMLRALGGSNAQRDMFVQILAHAAMRRRDQAALSDLMAMRQLLKRDDSFSARVAPASATV